MHIKVLLKYRKRLKFREKRLTHECQNHALSSQNVAVFPPWTITISS